MKALVSGSTGFIGTHLVKELIAKEYTVVAIPHSYLLNKNQLTDFFHYHNPDYIFHLAAYGVKNSQKDIETIFNVNIHGTYNMLTASLNIPYKAFINVGSAFEYGKKSKPMKESDLPEPVEMYGATKVGSTYLAHAFAKQFVKPVVTVRPFYVYGEGDTEDRFIQLIINAILNKKILKYCPDAVHDLVYVKDVTSAMIHIAEQIKNVKKIVINIGTESQYTNKQVVETLVNISGKDVSHLFIPSKKMRSTDISNVVSADVSILQSLGWKQKHSLEEGLRETFIYYKKNRNNKISFINQSCLFYNLSRILVTNATPRAD